MCFCKTPLLEWFVEDAMDRFFMGIEVPVVLREYE